MKQRETKIEEEHWRRERRLEEKETEIQVRRKGNLKRKEKISEDEGKKIGGERK